MELIALELGRPLVVETEAAPAEAAEPAVMAARLLTDKAAALEKEAAEAAAAAAPARPDALDDAWAALPARAPCVAVRGGADVARHPRRVARVAPRRQGREHVDGAHE